MSCAGKVSQVVFGMVDQTGVRANIVGGGIAEAGMHTIHLQHMKGWCDCNTNSACHCYVPPRCASSILCACVHVLHPATLHFCTGAQQAGDMMQDLKTGHLLGGSPRAQFFAQLIGSAVSIVVAVAAYELYKVGSKSSVYPLNFPVINSVPPDRFVGCMLLLPHASLQVAYGVPDRLRPPSSEVWATEPHKTRLSIGRFG